MHDVIRLGLGCLSILAGQAVLAQAAVPPSTPTGGVPGSIKKGDTLRLRMDIPGFKRAEAEQFPSDVKASPPPGSACAKEGTRLEVVATTDKTVTVRPYRLGLGEFGLCDPSVFGVTTAIKEDAQYFVPRENFVEGSFRRSGFVHGALFVPFKRRFSDRVLSGEGNLGYFVGYEVTEWRGWSLIPIASMGISLVNVDDNNADTSAAQRSDTGVRAAFTKSIGLVLKSFDSFQIGFILGHDRIGGDTTWKYENKPWMSVSIGFPFTQ